MAAATPVHSLKETLEETDLMAKESEKKTKENVPVQGPKARSSGLMGRFWGHLSGSKKSDQPPKKKGTVSFGGAESKKRKKHHWLSSGTILRESTLCPIIIGVSSRPSISWYTIYIFSVNTVKDIIVYYSDHYLVQSTKLLVEKNTKL